MNLSFDAYGYWKALMMLFDAIVVIVLFFFYPQQYVLQAGRHLEPCVINLTPDFWCPGTLLSLTVNLRGEVCLKSPGNCDMENGHRSETFVRYLLSLFCQNWFIKFPL